MTTTEDRQKTHSQNGHSQSYTQDLNARTYILSMRDQGTKPAEMPDVGKWAQCIEHIVKVYDTYEENVEEHPRFDAEKTPPKNHAIKEAVASIIHMFSRTIYPG